MEQTADGMSYAEVRDLLAAHFRELLGQRQASIDAAGRLSILDRQALENSVAIAKQALKKGEALALVEPDDAMLTRFMELRGVSFPKDSDQYAWLAEEMKRSYRDYAKAVLAYDDSLDTFDFDTAQVKRSEPTTTAIRSGMSLRELGASYTREKQIGGSWVAKTKLEKADHIALLEEILGSEFDVGTLNAPHAKRVKDTLTAYPKNREKNPATRGRKLSDALSVQGVETISVPTVNKYLQTYSDMFEWGVRNNHVEVNRFSGLTIRQNKKRTQIEREAFTPEQARLLIQTVVGNDRGLISKDYQKWGPLIGIYSGARLNEISQIHLKDIRKQDDIWCFDLNEDEDKSLKTDSSRRLVPIHHELLRLGLLEHVEVLRASGKQKLFPDFSYDPSNGWGRTVGRWFNDTLLSKLGLKTKSLVFHSLRHTVVTRLMQADVAEPIVKALVGHQQQGVTQQHYFKQGYTVAQLHDAISRLRY